MRNPHLQERGRLNFLVWGPAPTGAADAEWGNSIYHVSIDFSFLSDGESYRGSKNGVTGVEQNDSPIIVTEADFLLFLPTHI